MKKNLVCVGPKKVIKLYGMSFQRWTYEVYVEKADGKKFMSKI